MTAEHDWLNKPSANDLQAAHDQAHQQVVSQLTQERLSQIARRTTLAVKLEKAVMDQIESWIDDDCLWDDTDYPAMAVNYLSAVAYLKAKD